MDAVVCVCGGESVAAPPGHAGRSFHSALRLDRMRIVRGVLTFWWRPTSFGVSKDRLAHASDDEDPVQEASTTPKCFMCHAHVIRLRIRRNTEQERART
ncbi:hypothetical protein EXIGLDRAFT_431014 [Exidia glandulosa HHB12029]|uniref:Uncharacterized protein n=1 Tax=Exidia glandulosa HHB12029 TaxID=1314781 RepID=A0A165BAQ1_EXIGL|nr:hypothetical protein EXIGLDRAFT_431014 [Exidia glandulosa HHB12029]